MPTRRLTAASAADRTGPALAFLAFLAVLFCWPIFVDTSLLGAWDWDTEMLFYAAARDAVLKHGQFPLWTPLYNGGFPLLARAESSVSSPFFLLILAFGAQVGVRLSILAHAFFGLAGMYLLGRDLGLRGRVAVFVAGVYALSSAFALEVTMGETHHLATAFLPFVYLFFHRGAADRKALFLSGAFWALIIMDGGAYESVIAGFFLLVVAARQRRWRDLALVAAAAFCVGAVKILPFAALMGAHPRVLPLDRTAYRWDALLAALTRPDQTVGSSLWSDYRFDLGPDANGLYVGWGALALAAVGARAARTKRPELNAAVAVLALLMLAPPAWRLLRMLPVFSSMEVVQRFRVPFLMALALLAGLGAERVMVWVEARPSMAARRWAGGAFAAFLLVYPLHTAWLGSRIFEDAFRVSPAPTPKEFPSRVKIEYCTPMSAYECVYGAYPAYLAGWGTVDPFLSHGSLPNAVGSFERQRYRVEARVLDGAGTVGEVEAASGRVVVGVSMRGPGSLVVGENYYDGWRAVGAGARVEPHDGLLSVPLDAGARRVALYYMPTEFFVGALLTAASVLALLLLIVV